jgi:hypothetical protein
MVSAGVLNFAGRQRNAPQRAGAALHLDVEHDRCPDGYLAFTDGPDVLLVLS